MLKTYTERPWYMGRTWQFCARVRCGGGVSDGESCVGGRGRSRAPARSVSSREGRFSARDSYTCLASNLVNYKSIKFSGPRFVRGILNYRMRITQLFAFHFYLRVFCLFFKVITSSNDIV